MPWARWWPEVPLDQYYFMTLNAALLTFKLMQYVCSDRKWEEFISQLVKHLVTLTVFSALEPPALCQTSMFICYLDLNTLHSLFTVSKWRWWTSLCPYRFFGLCTIWRKTGKKSVTRACYTMKKDRNYRCLVHVGRKHCKFEVSKGFVLECILIAQYLSSI